MKSIQILVLCLVVVSLSACDNNTLPPEKKLPEGESSLLLTGTGQVLYDKYEPLTSRPIQVFYHIPKKATVYSPVLFAFHGAGRDGKNMRDVLINDANTFGFIVVCPEFSNEFYPGNNSYIFGNVFKDGENPSLQTINSEEAWTFSVIDPIFDYFIDRIGSKASKYDVFGHSAGAQFAHRFVYFKPNAKIDRVISSAAGWYTLPDTLVKFPYGLGSSYVKTSHLNDIFAKNIQIIVGELDNNPNDDLVRHNEFADAQGLHRLARANYFYSQSKKIAENLKLNFNWKIQTIPNATHDLKTISQTAVTLFYK